MGLEQKFQHADDAKRARGASIRKALATFLRNHPEFYPCEHNEQVMFAAMESPENDHLTPTGVSSWEILYSENRDKLIEAHATRKQAAHRTPPAAPGLTRQEVESWTAKQLQRELESPRRAAEIEAALSR
jgi:hypothetical protein